MTTQELHTSVNFDTYVARMDSVKDKDDIRSYVPEGATVLDYGCGSGPISELFPADLYTGYDLSPEMVDIARKNHPSRNFTNVLETSDMYDCVVFSSVLHEIYSYNNHDLSEVSKVLEEAQSHLNPGGTIVIRDGIDVGSHFENQFILKDPDDAEKFLDKLHEESPFSFGSLMVWEESLYGELQDIVHFLNVYTWGWGSVERELHERVNFIRFYELEELVKDAGFAVVQHDAISQEDYFHHLSKLVDLREVRWVTKQFLVAAVE